MTYPKLSSLRLPAFLIAAPFIVVACAGTVAEDATQAPEVAQATAAAEADPAGAAGGGDAADAEAAAEPTWLDIELTDAETGEAFTLASLEGQVVAIEPMAIWCTNCKRQQDNVQQVYPELADSNVTFISLGVDPNESDQALSRYAENRGYEWTFAKSPVEFSRALSDLFGPQILSVPSTPLIVLDTEGELFTQELGFHGPDKLREIFGEAAAQTAA